MDVNLSSPPPPPAFSPEQIARFFFPTVDDTGAPTGWWWCKTCARPYRQAEGRGYTNLVAHVRAQHSDFEALMLLSWVSKKAQSRFGWLSWVVEESLPLAFCEKETTRRNTKLSPVSVDTLRDNLIDAASALERKVAMELPAKFGIVFDGWTHDNEHYLACSQPSHLNAIREVLGYYGKQVEQLRALLGQLKNVESVSKRIQSHDVTMWEVRTLFDALIQLFPQFDEYLGPNAEIVGYPVYESAVVKLQSGR
ncbi:hypothetical protein ATCC90586_000741 [Pythium insidiosum]|nr:hypothetical protein ATCC90586_000741 [Pythium insidiosum]